MEIMFCSAWMQDASTFTTYQYIGVESPRKMRFCVFISVLTVSIFCANVCDNPGNSKCYLHNLYSINHLVVSASLSFCQTAGNHMKVANYLSNNVQLTDNNHRESGVINFLKGQLIASKGSDLPIF